MESTLRQFDRIMQSCQEIFLNKQKDYGTSWRIFRPSSLTDQLFIKAKRLRSIEEKGTQKINDSIDGEYMALINYSILAIIQLKLPEDTPLELDAQQVGNLYAEEVSVTRALLEKKKS